MKNRYILSCLFLILIFFWISNVTICTAKTITVCVGGKNLYHLLHPMLDHNGSSTISFDTHKEVSWSKYLLDKETNIHNQFLEVTPLYAVSEFIEQKNSKWHEYDNVYESKNDIGEVQFYEDPSNNKIRLQEEKGINELNPDSNGCKQQNCLVWLRINKSVQKLYIYIEGSIIDSFNISTGDIRHETPVMEKRPTGPMYVKYTSKRFPGGDYKGLGNMPYAIFISGGYAIHGTTKGNFPKLGRKASHGCIRLHPLNAKIVFDYLKEYGLNNCWITIQEKETN